MTTGIPHCSHPDCHAEIPTGRFACGPHWFALPRPIRNRIWAAWRAYLEPPVDRPRTLAAWERYEAAVGDAKAHWLSSDGP